eukprot:COSAG05_NODE_12024_length_486_cov_1.333333_1_plen_129_part_01
MDIIRHHFHSPRPFHGTLASLDRYHRRRLGGIAGAHSSHLLSEEEANAYASTGTAKRAPDREKLMRKQVELERQRQKIVLQANISSLLESALHNDGSTTSPNSSRDDGVNMLNRSVNMLDDSPSAQDRP